MSTQDTLAETLWETGWQDCVRRGKCRHRPCTAAQGVMCCGECSNHKLCKSRCKRARRTK